MGLSGKTEELSITVEGPALPSVNHSPLVLVTLEEELVAQLTRCFIAVDHRRRGRPMAGNANNCNASGGSESFNNCAWGQLVKHSVAIIGPIRESAPTWP